MFTGLQASLPSGAGVMNDIVLSEEESSGTGCMSAEMAASLQQMVATASLLPPASVNSELRDSRYGGECGVNIFMLGK